MGKKTALFALCAAGFCLSTASLSALAKEKLHVELREWNVTLNKESVRAGDVTVTVSNKGREEHELVFLKLDTDSPVGRLPVNRDGGIDEDTMDFGTLVAEIEELEPGKRKRDTFRLSPGRYAVVCNMIEEEPDGEIEAHYSMGMSALLTVE